MPRHADYSAIDLLRDDGRIERIATRHARLSTLEAMSAAEATHPGWEAQVRAVLTHGTSSSRFEGDGSPTDELSLVMAAGGLTSWAVVAIRVRGLSFGAVTIATSGSRRGIRSSGVEAYEDVAGRAAVAIERGLLYREATQNAAAALERADRLTRLIDATIVLHRNLRPGALLDALVEQAIRVLDATYALARLDAGDWLPVERGAHAEGAVTATTSLVDHDGARIGELVVQRPDGRALTADDEGILTVLARLASVALHNARLYDDVSSREQRLQALIEASPLAILELDLFGNVLSVNPAATRLFADGRDGAGVELPGLLAAELTTLAPRAAGGQPHQVELSVTTAGERSLDLWVSAAPLREPTGLATGALVIINDITSRKALEGQLLAAQRFEAIAQLAGGVAHDFNNLLTVIVGYSEMLLRKMTDDTPERDLVEPIHEAGRHASVITNQLLTLSKHQVMHPVVLRPGDVVTELLPMLQRLAGRRVEVTARITDTDAMIRADPGQLEQVLLNLVLNSRDASPRQGTVTIEVRQQAGAVLVSVADQGRGMDDATLARCCEPFFTTKGRNRGTGLGLATVKTVVDRSGGSLEIESRLGEGTTITARFPPAGSGPRADPIGDGPARPTTVLVVDDDVQVRWVAVEALAEAGYEVVVAGDALSCVRRAAGRRRPRRHGERRRDAGNERHRPRSHGDRPVARHRAGAGHRLRRRGRQRGERHRRGRAGQAVHRRRAPAGRRRCADRTPGTSALEPVAHASHRVHPTRLVGIGLDLVAHAPDVLGHRGRILPVGRRVPHLREKLLTGEHLPRRRSEVGEQVELLRGQRDLGATDRHLSGAQVDLQLAE